MVSKKEIIWTLTSIKDKIEIFEFWRNKTKSDRYPNKLNQLFDKAADLLSIYPELGLRTDFLDVRVKTVKEYSIYYRISKNEIQIIRVWYSGKDPYKLKIK